MDTLIEVSDSVFTVVSSFWTILVTSYGTVGALIICGVLVVGIYCISKFCLKWIVNKFKNLFNKKSEVSLPSRTY